MSRNSSVVLRNGGSDEADGRERWHKSSNGVSFDGKMISSDQKLALGRTAKVVLAPYVVSGGALALSLEPRGRSHGIGRCDRSCELDSVAILRGDIPDAPTSSSGARPKETISSTPAPASTSGWSADDSAFAAPTAFRSGLSILSARTYPGPTSTYNGNGSSEFRKSGTSNPPPTKEDTP